MVNTLLQNLTTWKAGILAATLPKFSKCEVPHHHIDENRG